MAILLDDLQFGQVAKTSQKFLGKTVYAKLIDFGALPAENTEKSVAHGITNIDQFGIDNSRSYVDQGNGNRHALFYPNTVANAFWRAKVNETHVAIQVGQARTGFTAVVCVWFTKMYEIAEPGEDHSDYPGEAHFTVLGASGDQRGHHVTRHNDTIVISGMCNSGGVTSLIATYDPSLRLTDKRLHGEIGQYSKVLPAPWGYIGASQNKLKFTRMDANLSPLGGTSYDASGVADFCAAPEGSDSPYGYVSVGNRGGYGLICGLNQQGAMMKCIVHTTDRGKGDLYKVIMDDDRIVAVGQVSGYGLISVYDKSLNLVENIKISNSGTIHLKGLAKTPTGYVVGGHTDANGTWNLMLMVLDEDFNVVKKALIRKAWEQLNDLKVDQAGNIAILATSRLGSSLGTNKGLFMLLDPELNIKTQHFLQGSYGTEYKSLHINNVGNYLITGRSTIVSNGGDKAFLLNLVGKIEDVNGSISKYPSMRINTASEFTASDQFTLTINRNHIQSQGVYNIGSSSYSVTTVPNSLVQDPGAVIIASLPLDN